jgi:hypothetical protein
MAWGQLPTLWAEAVAQRAGYRLGRRLERLPESVTPPKPASSREEPQAPAADLAA